LVIDKNSTCTAAEMHTHPKAHRKQVVNLKRAVIKSYSSLGFRSCISWLKNSRYL